MTTVYREAGISDEEILDLLPPALRPRPGAGGGVDPLAGAASVLKPGVDEQDLAQRYAYTASQLSPMLGRW